MEPSSPLSESGSPIPGFVTPRTKIARMMADIEDAFDNAPAPSPSKFQYSQQPLGEQLTAQPSSYSSPVTSQSQAIAGQDVTNVDGEDGSDADDSDDAVRKPQGRAARRMLGSHMASPQPQVDRDQTNVDEDQDELYSVTPVRRRAPVKSHSPSPTGSENGGGLFVSPAKSGHGNSDDEDELPVNPLGNKEKLAELVAKKCAERLAKEAEAKERDQQAASSDLPEGAYEDADDTPQDPQIEKIMSDASRPARKASKKALEEMERETQRLARQQALAHQMKVKKKFTTNDLFAKFNFKRPGAADTPADQPTEGDTTASSVPNSDGIEERTKDPHSTPPSSPPSPLDVQKDLVEKGALSKLVPVRQDSIASLAELDDDEQLPDNLEVMKGTQKKRLETSTVIEPQPEKKGLKLARLGKKAALPPKDDSEDELEIIQQLPAHLRAFDKVAGSARVTRPAVSRAIHNLKHLSHFNSREGQPQKKGSRPSVGPKALEFQLRKRAKEQARLQQLERIEELRAKGIEVQTAEEREKEAEAFENLLEKARQDAVELRKAEKVARKEAGGETALEVSEDEDEDDDYVGSGSEEEDGADGDDEREQDENELLDEVAEETDEEEDDADVEDADAEMQLDEEESESEHPGQEDLAVQNERFETQSNSKLGLEDNGQVRKARLSRVIKDDEDDEEEPEEESNEIPETNAEQHDDPFAAFNFGGVDTDLLMSPTQAFHATMQTPTQATQEDSFDILRRIAPMSASSLPPTLPDLDTQNDDETQFSFVAGSQVPESQRVNLQWETQPPETPAPIGLRRGPSALSETPGWEPTQDPGLPSPWSVAPKARRESTLDSIAELETQSTVELRVSESPAPSQQPAPKRGRLGHRRVPLLEDSDDELAAPPASVKPEKRDAFREMARRRKEALTAAERLDVEKEMRGMMEEQAEESEDEYAGLGGDDYVAPETEQDREMIDSSHIDVDERALAAHFAERQRLRDEEETSKLYKDLTTGVLRRKMGANAFDLDEDEDEVAARRRQMRQQEEARKRRALLKDENIATLAEGKNSKGKDAFLKAIADDDGDEEMVGLSDDEAGSAPATQDDSTQPESQRPAPAPLREISGNKRKLSDGEEGTDDRAPAKLRRTQASAFRRPTSLLEVKESVSFLLDEPDGGLAFGPTALEPDTDSENEEQQDELEETDGEDEVTAEAARQNDGGYAPNPASMEAKAMPPPRLPASQRRTASKAAVVDRLMLKRGSSTSESSSSGHSRTAWAAGPATGGFKVPSLLRRATTNSTTSSNNGGVTTPVLSRENSGVKMGGTKKSSLAYQARAEERKAIVEASAKRRQENTAKIAAMRRTSSVLGRGLTGRFE